MWSYLGISLCIFSHCFAVIVTVFMDDSTLIFCSMASCVENREPGRVWCSQCVYLCLRLTLVLIITLVIRSGKNWMPIICFGTVGKHGIFQTSLKYRYTCKINMLSTIVSTYSLLTIPLSYFLYQENIRKAIALSGKILNPV